MPVNLPPLPVPVAPAAPAPVLEDAPTITELAKAAAPAALRVLHEMAHDPDVKPAARVAAANAIIDRAEGKVGIAQETTVNYSVIINQINRVMLHDPD